MSGRIATLIALYRETALLGDDDVISYMRAQQIQLDRDFTPEWGKSATLLFVPPGDLIPPDAWQCVFLDNSDQADALGYHALTALGLPIMKVFVADDKALGLNWTVTASHEMIETMGDPMIDQTVQIHDQETGVILEYARELCDCCEDDRFAYPIDDGHGREHLMSDFAYKAWFMSHALEAGLTRFTHRDTVDGPFKLAVGGYIGVRQLVPKETPWGMRLGQGEISPRQEKGKTSRTMRRFHAPTGG